MHLSNAIWQALNVRPQERVNDHQELLRNLQLKRHPVLITRQETSLMQYYFLLGDQVHAS